MQRKFIFDGGQSRRYHTMSVIKEQNIAEHSFGVAWFCELLTQGRASKNLIMAALSHDLAEHMVGDVPSPVKRELAVRDKFDEYELAHLRVAGLATYTDELFEGERITLELADMLDGMAYCVKERSFGNRRMDLVFERFHLYALRVVQTRKTMEEATSWSFSVDIAEEFIDSIFNEWRELNDKSK